MLGRNNRVHWVHKVAEEYDKFAKEYAEVEASVNLQNFNDKIISMLEPLKGMEVLDAGCGAGIHMKMMLERGAKVTGVDISNNLIEIAKEGCKKFACFKLLEADIENTDFPTQKFDRILSSFEIMYHKDLKTIFKKFNKFLKTKGLLLLLATHPVRNMGIGSKYNYYKEKFKEKWAIGLTTEKYHHRCEDLINSLVECGFSIKRLEEPVPPEVKVQVYDFEIKYPKGTIYPQAVLILAENIGSHNFVMREKVGQYVETL